MDFIAEREKQITELVALWKKATGKTKADFNKAIMKKFQTTSGLDSLSFEYIAEVREGLLKTINSKKTKGTQTL